MPELPEVETIRCDLERVLVGKKITSIKILDNKIIGNKPTIFELAIKNKKIVGVERRGKLLAFALSSGEYLLAHMKMTGQLIFLSSRRKSVSLSNTIAGGHQIGQSDLHVPNKFTRVIINFSDGVLYFNDLRRFGYLKIVSREEKEKVFEQNFGIEPLTPNFKFNNFVKIFQNRQTNLKAILMNQKLISGLGNIYVDEACFCAGLLPWRKARSLKPAELKKLFSCIQKVIKVAIKNRGTTFKDFRDGAGGRGSHYNFLNVYGRKDEKCRKCKSLIKKTKHAGRGTHYCEKCQK